MKPTRYRTWIEVDTQRLENNFRALSAFVKPNTAIMAVLKGNAWGLGLPDCAKVLAGAGVDWLGVTSVEDVQLLRQDQNIGPLPILLLCEPPEQTLESVAVTGARMTVYSIATARRLSRIGVRIKRPIPVHMKINTGLNRFGVRPDRVLSFVKEVSLLPGLKLEGVFTHFSNAEDMDDCSLTRKQFSIFQEIIGKLADRGFNFTYIHAANSAALIIEPTTHLDMVRPGMALIGLYPGKGLIKRLTLQSPITWKARIVQFHNLKIGDTVGYGGHYTCPEDTLTATLSVGFADGLSKRFLNSGCVLIGGRLCPILAICMDACMVRLGPSDSEIPSPREAVILGSQGEKELNPRDVASSMGADVEELLCGIGSRVPRFYK